MLVALVIGVTATAASSQTLPSGVVTDANWIMQAVLPGGAIQLYPGNAPHDIEPYFANYAAMGLARAGVLTGNASYTNAAWNWLRWYAAHEGTNGFVTDYTMNASGVATSTGTEDSTDAYAGTFLTAVGMAYYTDPTPGRSLLSGIEGAITAIRATQQSDGLTWATPSYLAKYLMDNGEAYDGLRAAATVLTSLGVPSWASVATTAANSMLKGIQGMWNSSANNFNWVKFWNGSMQTTNWSVLYPDALEQASAAAFHVAAGHANSLMSTFDLLQAQAAAPAVDGYQPLAVIGVEATGNAALGVSEAQAIDAYANATNRAWPFNVAVAGQQVFGLTDSALVGA